MLEGIVVVEFGRIFSAPLAGMILSDLGARVIKVERKDKGDESRHFGKELEEGVSDYFFALNRKKEIVQLDLKDGQDLGAAKELLAGADVLIHNSLQKSFDALGLSYEIVRGLNPGIIYAAVSGYGSESKNKNIPSQDVTIQGLSGFMSLNGSPDGTPVKTGVPVIDMATGQYLVIGILAALLERGKTGRGRFVSASLLESAVSMTSVESVRYLNTGIVSKSNKNRHHSIAPYNSFKTLDGYVLIAIANDVMFERFARALDIPAEGFETNGQRFRDIDRLEDIIGERTLKHTTAGLVRLLKDSGVSCGPVNDMAQALNSEEVRDLDIIAQDGQFKYIKTPINFR